MNRLESLTNEAKQTRVCDAWVVVHSARAALFYIEQLANAVTKNFRSFAAAAGEDWQIIGIFSSLREAHEAVTAWIRRPGTRRPRKCETM